MSYDLSTKKALIFDFDGVLIDSEEIRAKGIVNLFVSFPEKTREIYNYYKTHQGVNRVFVFKAIYEDILHLPYSNEIEEELKTRYSKEIIDKVAQEAELIPGAKEFLIKHQGISFLATSGPQNDVERLLKAKGIFNLFKKIYAHPVTKTEAIKDVISLLKIEPKEAVFFGDAEADFKAAREAGCDFIARTENRDLFPRETFCMKDFRDLS